MLAWVPPGITHSPAYTHASTPLSLSVSLSLSLSTDECSQPVDHGQNPVHGRVQSTQWREAHPDDCGPVSQEGFGSINQMCPPNTFNSTLISFLCFDLKQLQ